MTVTELINLLSKYPGDTMVLVETGKEGEIFDFNDAASLMNVEDGRMISEEGDDDFNEADSVLVLNAAI